MIDYKKEMYKLINRLTEVMIKHVEDLEEIAETEQRENFGNLTLDSDQEHEPVTYVSKKRK